MNLEKLPFEKIQTFGGSCSSVKKMLIFSPRARKWLLSLLCLTACLYQLQESAVQYFAYKTVSKLSIRMVTETKPPALTLCYSFGGRMPRKPKLTDVFRVMQTSPWLVIQSDVETGTTENFVKSMKMCTTFHPNTTNVITSNPQNEMFTVSIWNGTQFTHFQTNVLLHEADYRVHGKYDSFTFLTIPNTNRRITLFSLFF